MSMEARSKLFRRRLGRPAELAESTIDAYQRRTFSGRHPLAMFLVAPLPLLVAGWLATLAVPALLIAALERWGGFDLKTVVDGPRTDVWYAAAILYNAAAQWLPPAFVVLWIASRARRAGRGWGWAAAGSLLVALLAGAYVSQLVLSFDFPRKPDSGKLMLGLGLNSIPTLKQTLQFALPALVAAFCLMRTFRRGAKQLAAAETTSVAAPHFG